MATRNSTSPWIYIGCGCLALAVFAVALVIGGGYFGYSTIRGYVEDLEDPQRRNERALELLGAERLPEGYYTLFFIPVPWVLDFVMLTDSEAANQSLAEIDQGVEEGLLDGHIFFYLRAFIATDPSDNDHFGVVRHQLDDGRLRIEVSDQRFISRQQLAEGVFVNGRQESRWSGHRGAYLDESGHDFDGLFSVVEIFCGDDALRSAVWFQRTPDGEIPAASDASPNSASTVEDPTPEDPTLEDPTVGGATQQATGPDTTDVEAPLHPGSVTDARLTGTPADGAALERFMGHFDLCAK